MKKERMYRRSQSFFALFSTLPLQWYFLIIYLPIHFFFCTLFTYPFNLMYFDHQDNRTIWEEFHNKKALLLDDTTVLYYCMATALKTGKTDALFQFFNSAPRKIRRLVGYLAVEMGNIEVINRYVSSKFGKELLEKWFYNAVENGH